MNQQIKMVAVDIDGTFVHADYTYDKERFERILFHMKEIGCRFVVASGNQYYQLRDIFPQYYDELSFVAENGAFVKDQAELVFTAAMPGISPAQKSLATTKDTTKAIETRAGVLKDAETELPKFKANVYLQYLGKEFNTKDILIKAKNMWMKESGKGPEAIKSINIYLKPEEFAAYYVINDDATGKIEL